VFRQESGKSFHGVPTGIDQVSLAGIPPAGTLLRNGPCQVTGRFRNSRLGPVGALKAFSRNSRGPGEGYLRLARVLARTTLRKLLSCPPFFVAMAGLEPHECVCIVCLDSDPPPIQSGCACRSDTGLAHVGCLIERAVAKQPHRGDAVWWECQTCGQRFTGAMQTGASSCFPDAHRQQGGHTTPQRSISRIKHDLHRRNAQSARFPATPACASRAQRLPRRAHVSMTGRAGHTRLGSRRLSVGGGRCPEI
jgi:hypothetical protein